MRYLVTDGSYGYNEAINIKHDKDCQKRIKNKLKNNSLTIHKRPIVPTGHFPAKQGRI